MSRLHKMTSTDLPSILFVDVRMERPDSGLVLLREIRRRRKLKLVPVVIISGGGEDEDIKRAYEGGANLYVLKSSGPGEFSRAIKALVSFVSKNGRLPADTTGN